MVAEAKRGASDPPGYANDLADCVSMSGVQEHPLVLPQVSHFRQVPFLTMVKLPHSEQFSPS